MTWRLAHDICQNRGEFPPESMIDEDWVDEWYDLRIGEAGYFSFADLIAAAKRQGVERAIFVTGFGAGASRASIGRWQRLPFQIVFGRAYGDKSLQEKLIKESELDWTIARTGVLTNGPRTGRYRILAEASQWRNGIISRADVAEFLVRQIGDGAYIRKTPVLIN